MPDRRRRTPVLHGIRGLHRSVSAMRSLSALATFDRTYKKPRHAQQAKRQGFADRAGRNHRLAPRVFEV
jgi:hypothetical protein